MPDFEFEVSHTQMAGGRKHAAIYKNYFFVVVFFNAYVAVCVHRKRATE